LTPVPVRGHEVLTATNPGLNVASANAVQLRLIETTDLHLHLMPYDYYSDEKVSGLGLVEAATLIAKARAEVANALLMDNGDFLQGTPLGDCLAFGRGFREGDAVCWDRGE
jgi:2',3'-cyclic-nucleotide 2'-phosphodiesterase / 3'-nucleotidase